MVHATTIDFGAEMDWGGERNPDSSDVNLGHVLDWTFTVGVTARDVAVVKAESEPGSVKKQKAEYSSLD